jgi:hypothetical protein
MLDYNYNVACRQKSDIQEHLKTLRLYGEKCNHITECGVRMVVSSYAFAMALKGKTPNKFVQVDLQSNARIEAFKEECKAEGVFVIFYQQNDLECPLEQTDLLFLDTWHVYGHLKLELARWHPYVNKYIIIHDTTIDAEMGESIRMGADIAKLSSITKLPVDEIKKGIWPAIEKFVQKNPWRIRERFTNNNGLTVLEKVIKML